MTDIFMKIVHLSMLSSFISIAIIILRIIFKKIPRGYMYVLWVVLLIRLLCPFAFTGSISIFNVIPKDVQNKIVINSDIEKVFVEEPNIEIIDDSDLIVKSSIMNLKDILSYVWVAGLIILVSYVMFKYIRLKFGLKFATKVNDKIYETDRIICPFIMGIIVPRIYLPVNLDIAEQEYILEHEMCHIKRKDYIVKFLYFIAVALHWFNPIIWISYFMMVKDMEMSCDEMVMKNYDKDIRKQYSSSLLSMSIKQSNFNFCLSFGESNVKERVKNVLNYKKKNIIISIVLSVVILLVGVLFMINPKHKLSSVQNKNVEYVSLSHGYSVVLPSELEGRVNMLETPNTIQIACGMVVEKQNAGGVLGKIYEVDKELYKDKSEFEKYIIEESPVKVKILEESSDKYICYSPASDMQYLPEDKEVEKEFIEITKVLDDKGIIIELSEREEKPVNKIINDTDLSDTKVGFILDEIKQFLDMTYKDNYIFENYYANFYNHTKENDKEYLDVDIKVDMILINNLKNSDTIKQMQEEIRLEKDIDTKKSKQKELDSYVKEIDEYYNQDNESTFCFRVELGENPETILFYRQDTSKGKIITKIVRESKDFNIIGVWQDSLGVGNTYTNKYHFFKDNTFVYYYSFVNEERRNFSICGKWLIDNNMLCLKILNKTVLEGGRFEPSPLDSSKKCLVDFKKVKYKVDPAKEIKYSLENIKESTNNPKSILVGDTMFYQLATDPNSYREFLNE